ncbi:MAG TPA: tetratricopeptide repeat protein [Micromonosporaceae bacterium]|nr:tetratricopeptide repeat protein [Micromonosporaceae bacterium]
MPLADEPEPLRRALQLGIEERYAEAIDLLRGYLDDNPGDALGWRRLAGAHIGADELAKAQQAAQEAITRDPEHPAAHRLLGLARYFAGAYPGAEAAAREALRRDEADPEAHALLAMALLRLPGGWSAARTAAGRTVALDRNNRAAVRVAGDVRLLASARWAALAVPAAGGLAIPLLVVAGLLVTGGSIPGLWILLTVAGLASVVAGAGTLLLNRRGHAAGPPARELLATSPGAQPPVLTGLALSVLTGAAASLTTAAAGGKPSTQLGIGILTAAFAAFLSFSGRQPEASQSPARTSPARTVTAPPAASPAASAPAYGPDATSRAAPAEPRPWPRPANPSTD